MHWGKDRRGVLVLSLNFPEHTALPERTVTQPTQKSASCFLGAALAVCLRYTHFLTPAFASLPLPHPDSAALSSRLRRTSQLLPPKLNSKGPQPLLLSFDTHRHSCTLSMAPNRDIKASGRTPAKTLHIPEEYRRETLLQEEKRLIDTWKKETTCEVVPTVIMESPRRIITQFRIFGTGSGGVDKAVKAINDWILATMTKSSGSGAWAKLEAWEYNKWYDNEVRKMENARKQRYKRPVPQGTELPPFKASGRSPAVLTIPF